MATYEKVLANTKSSVAKKGVGLVNPPLQVY
jgi:hypothetical protein